MNSVKSIVCEKYLNNTLKRESIIAPTKPTNITKDIRELSSLISLILLMKNDIK